MFIILLTPDEAIQQIVDMAIFIRDRLWDGMLYRWTILEEELLISF